MTFGNGVPIGATVTAGQAHESRHFEAAMSTARLQRRRPIWVLGDKVYSYPGIRRWCELRGVLDVIAQRSDQMAREGHRVFSDAIYKGRNVVERCVGWLKHNRRLSARYEKLTTR